MKERLTVLMIVALAVGVSAPTAQAGLFSLSLSDGVNTVAVADGDALDSSGTAGVITYIGSVGTVWTVNVTTGLSDSILGTPAMKKIDLNSVNVTTADAGTLTILLTETDLSLALLPQGETGVLTSLIGGTTTGTVELTQTLAGDGVFAELYSGLLGPGAFASTQVAAVPDLGSSLFSLTEKVIITHEGAGSTSFDAESTVVPVPGAILLGFLGLGAAGLKLRRFA